MLAPIAMALMLRHRGVAVAALLGLVGLAGEIQGFGRYEEHHRSFFGVTHLTTVHPEALGPTRIMVHGTTLHGAQALSPARRCQPTSYYATGTVIGTAFRIQQALHPSLRYGAVGLGAGTVATFVRPGDRMRFFEIDPLVARTSLDPENFSFVPGCAKGPVDVVLGDARLSLAKEKAGAFDLLLVDAFSSDSVPTHLLTVEALRTYLHVTAPDGVIVLHLSNRNLDLAPAAAAAAKAVGAASLLGEHWVDEQVSPYVETGGIVLLVARTPEPLGPYRQLAEWKDQRPAARPWTDDYTNVWGAMIARYRPN
jgi:predicted O-methyltransferase YrrM